MNSLRPFLALVACASAPLIAQQPDYVPAHRLPHGREIVAVYIGATDCVACLFPEVKAAVRDMKTLVAKQAKEMNASFSAIGVASDWDIKSATAFLEPLGAFDQIVLGGNWTNLAIERFIWRDSSATASMPQLLVLERTVTPESRRIGISEMRLLRRLVGGNEIPAWVAAGAPISLSDMKRP